MSSLNPLYTAYGVKGLMAGYACWQFPALINSMFLKCSGSGLNLIVRSQGIRQMAIGGSLILLSTKDDNDERNAMKKLLVKLNMFVDVVELMNLLIEYRKKEVDWTTISVLGANHLFSALFGGLLLFVDSCKKK